MADRSYLWLTVPLLVFGIVLLVIGYFASTLNLAIVLAGQTFVTAIIMFSLFHNLAEDMVALGSLLFLHLFLYSFIGIMAVLQSITLVLFGFHLLLGYIFFNGGFVGGNINRILLYRFTVFGFFHLKLKGFNYKNFDYRFMILQGLIGLFLVVLWYYH